MKFPEHFNNQQKEAYQKAWLATLRLLINGSKFIVFVAILLLLYIPLKDDIHDLFEAKPAIKYNSNPFSSDDIDYDLVENGIHIQTGLVFAAGFEEVRANCTVCHSSKLVTQNRASRAGWDQMIVWMQEKQGLWDLGEKKPVILDYLAKHYAPEQKGRRDNINIAEVEWYILNLEE